MHNCRRDVKQKIPIYKIQTDHTNEHLILHINLVALHHALKKKKKKEIGSKEIPSRLILAYLWYLTSNLKS